MTYDKYRTWNIPLIRPPGTHQQSLEEQVLEDLAATKDLTSQLEILDSFAVYKQREYRQSLASATADEVGRSLSTLFKPLFSSRIPEPWVPHRASMGQDSGSKLEK